MQFGVCCDPSLTAAARRAGFDYAEWSVGALLMPRAPRQDFLAALKQARAAALPYPVLNGFVPADLKITGQYVDASALKEYVTVAFERAEQAGVQMAGHSRLEQIRASMRGEALPTGGTAAPGAAPPATPGPAVPEQPFGQ